MTAKRRTSKTEDPAGARPATLRRARLQPPPLRDGTVRRERLTSRLRAGGTRLALVVAPAGSGKTTLLADWAASDDRAFCWLALDAVDDDPATLWADVVAALAAGAGLTGGSAVRDELAGAADPVEALVDRIRTAGTALVLVLDNAEALTSVPAYQALQRLIELAPPNLEIALSARREPAIAVSRIRAAGELVELRLPDLAFDLDETRRLLDSTIDPGSDPELAEALQRRTEGWPVGLALGARALRDAGDRSATVAAFGATNRHVADYLAEQIVEPLGDDTRRFLTGISIVETVSGSLADALTETPHSAARLAACERDNVLISPLDDRREWYRLHGLLAELLRIDLVRESPELLPVLHQRAAAWYAARGEPEPAVRHAIAAGDVDLAARVIGSTYLQQLELGRLPILVGWLDALGPAAIDADRRLAVVKAWTMHFLGRHEEGEVALGAALRAPSVGPLPDGARSIEATAALMGAAFPGGDAAGMLESARRAYELEARRDSPWRITVHVLLGFGLVRMGQFAEARDFLRLGAELGMESGLWMDALGARALLARVALETGDPEEAERLGRDALQLGQAHGLQATATYAFAQSVLGSILVRRGDAEAGAELLEAALPGTRAIREPLALGELYCALSLARRMTGRVAEAGDLLREVDTIIERSRHPGYLRSLRRLAAPTRDAGLPEGLSQRELEVLRILARGRSKRQTADELFVAFNTIHSHVRSIYRKLDVHSLAAAVARARQRGLIE